MTQMEHRVFHECLIDHPEIVVIPADGIVDWWRSGGCVVCHGTAITHVPVPMSTPAPQTPAPARRIRAHLVVDGQRIDDEWLIVGYGPSGLIARNEDGTKTVIDPQTMVAVSPMTLYQELAMLVEEGERVQALKLVRAQVGTSLRDAKKVVDALFPPNA